MLLMGLEPIEKLVSKTNTFTNFVTRALLGFPEDKPRLSTSPLSQPGARGLRLASPIPLWGARSLLGLWSPKGGLAGAGSPPKNAGSLRAATPAASRGYACGFPRASLRTSAAYALLRPLGEAALSFAESGPPGESRRVKRCREVWNFQ